MEEQRFTEPQGAGSTPVRGTAQAPSPLPERSWCKEVVDGVSRGSPSLSGPGLTGVQGDSPRPRTYIPQGGNSNAAETRGAAAEPADRTTAAAPPGTTPAAAEADHRSGQVAMDAEPFVFDSSDEQKQEARRCLDEWIAEGLRHKAAEEVAQGREASGDAA